MDGAPAWSKPPPLAAPQLGSCASSGRPWRLWAAWHSQGEAGPLSAPPLPKPPISPPLTIQERNEAEFRDDMYHSGFKLRVYMMSSLAFSVCIMILVDPCLTMLGVLTCPFNILLMASQITAKRMADRRRARHVGQWSLILICSGFAFAAVPIALLAQSGKAPTWDGHVCSHEMDETNHPLHVQSYGGAHVTASLKVLNLMVGPGSIFVGLIVTFMTISTRGFVVIVTGFLLPVCTACEWPPLEPCTHRSAHLE